MLQGELSWKVVIPQHGRFHLVEATG
jgi:hypothetical protein